MIPRDDLVRMAREAGAPSWWTGDGDSNVPGAKWLSRIVNSAAAAEREACALLCDEAADALDRTGRRVNQVDRHTADVLRRRAAAIRARGAA